MYLSIMVIVMDNKRTRTTRQLLSTLEELRRVPRHPTAGELYERLRKRLPHISLGTVYSNLKALCKAGQAVKLDYGSHEARYDGVVSPHAHVRCVHCGKAADMRIARLPDLKAHAQPVEGYEILDFRVEFSGICPRCRKRQPRQRRIASLAKP